MAKEIITRIPLGDSISFAALSPQDSDSGEAQCRSLIQARLTTHGLVVTADDLDDLDVGSYLTAPFVEVDLVAWMTQKTVTALRENGGTVTVKDPYVVVGSEEHQVARMVYLPGQTVVLNIRAGSTMRDIFTDTERPDDEADLEWWGAEVRQGRVPTPEIAINAAAVQGG